MISQKEKLSSLVVASEKTYLMLRLVVQMD